MKRIAPNNQLSECYFMPSTKTSSATVCKNCGKEKMIHTIGEGIKCTKITIITNQLPTKHKIEK